MTQHDALRERMAALCAEIGPEDGVNPRDSKSKPSFHKEKSNRKALQLCGQVRRALDLALAGAAEATLRELQVDAVLPAPDVRRLEVWLSPTSRDAALSEAEARAHLKRALPWLRTQVAAAISRKAVPDLVLRLSAPGEVPHGR